MARRKDDEWSLVARFGLQSEPDVVYFVKTRCDDEGNYELKCDCPQFRRSILNDEIPMCKHVRYCDEEVLDSFGAIPLRGRLPKALKEKSTDLLKLWAERNVFQYFDV